MFMRKTAVTALFLASVVPALAAQVGNAAQGQQLVEKSCSSCHATAVNATVGDGAPPLSFIAKDNKARPAWIRGWLMDPHPPMPGIMLSRQQVENIIAYLNTLPVR